MRPFEGVWRIADMALWGQDVLELDSSHITFDRNRLGSLQFVAVHGWLDYRSVEREGKPAVEFSSEGDNDGDAVCGRGWACIDGERLVGRLFIHNGDESSSVAVPKAGPNHGRRSP